MSQTTKFKRLQISGWRQFESIELDLHPKLTIITGANGAGKSTLLSVFNKHFGYTRNYLATPLTKGGLLSYTYDLFDAIRAGIKSLRKHQNEIGEIEYTNSQKASIRLPGHEALNYQIEIHGQQAVVGIHIDSHRPPNLYRHVGSISTTPPSVSGIGDGLNSEYQNFYSSGTLGQGSLHHIKMALIMMSMFGHGNPTMEPIPKLLSLFSGFEEKLRAMLPKSLGFRHLIIRSPEVLLATTTGNFLIDAASGGVIKLIEIAWQIYFFSQSNGEFVVTLDEPENHLHPSMQKSFLPNIISAFPGIQFIVVTHSPFIISAIQQSHVYVLRYAGDQNSNFKTDDDQSIKGLMGSRVFAERLDTINRAGSASEILREVLGISTTIPDWAEARVLKIIDEYRGTKLTDELLVRIYGQLEREGLASSYPTAVSALTRPQK